MMTRDIFPREVVSNAPHITLTGRELLHVEQHTGLIAYTPEEIILRTAADLLRVQGRQLRFSLYTAGEAMIEGEIIAISFGRKEERP